MLMGNSVPKAVKIRAEVLIQEKPELFSMNFEKNKKVMNDLELPVSKHNRNLIAGYIVRMLKDKEAKQ